jgi:hypothetical protein
MTGQDRQQDKMGQHMKPRVFMRHLDIDLLVLTVMLAPAQFLNSW